MKRALLYFLLLPTIIFSQWNWINPSTTSNTIQKIRPIGESEVIAIGNRGLILRSTDKGDTWQKINFNTNTDYYSMCTVNPNTTWILGNNYATDRNTILKSSDKGKDWEVAAEINSNPTCNWDNEELYEINFVNEKIGFICGRNRVEDVSYGRIYKSIDGGYNWSLIFDEPDFYIHNMSWLNENNGWFRNGAFIYETKNGGQSFSKIESTGLEAVDESGLIFFDEMNGICSGFPSKLTKDGGKTWYSNINYNEYNLGANSLFSSDFYFRDKNNGCIMYDQMTQRFLVTSDGGNTWINKGCPEYNNAFSESNIYNNLRTAFIYPNSDALVAGYKGDIYKYTNDFQSIDYKINYITRKDLTAIKFINEKTGWISGYNTILTTNDKGATWDLLAQPIRFEDIHFFNTQKGIGVGRITYFDNSLQQDRIDYGIFVTNDGGRNWTPQTLFWRDFTNATFTPGKVIFYDDNNGLVLPSIYGNEFFITSNGGASWRCDTLEIGTFGEGQYFSKDLIYFVGSAKANSLGTAMFFKSTDGCKTFSKTIIENAFVDLTDIFFASKNVGYAAGGYYFFKTIDGGETWSNVYTNLGDIFDIYFSNENTGWILCEFGNIKKTIDGGLTWKNQTGEENGLGLADHFIDTFCFINDSTAFGIGWFGSIIKTDNGGGITDLNYEKPIQFEYTLNQNYPNPFNPSTEIMFTLPISGHVSLKVYDILGREVRTLVNQELTGGSHKVIFDARNLSSGIYFYRLQNGNYSQTKKMILVK
ncbi:MAG: T9SS type A sorting domain-containing protein [Melioribacteraceae bacterium]